MNPNLKIFIGYDSREKIAFHVLSYSIIAKATIPVSITPINLNNLKRFYNRPRGKNESTEFSISRFLTPYLSNFEGYSLYLDCDFIMLENVAKLLKFVAKKSNKTLWCVKHKYKPRHTTKFLKEKQFIYPKKNWSSFMLFNNKKRPCDSDRAYCDDGYRQKNTILVKESIPDEIKSYGVIDKPLDVPVKQEYDITDQYYCRDVCRLGFASLS